MALNAISFLVYNGCDNVNAAEALMYTEQNF